MFGLPVWKKKMKNVQPLSYDTIPKERQKAGRTGLVTRLRFFE